VAKARQSLHDIEVGHGNVQEHFTNLRRDLSALASQLSFPTTPGDHKIPHYEAYLVLQSKIQLIAIPLELTAVKELKLALEEFGTFFQSLVEDHALLKTQVASLHERDTDKEFRIASLEVALSQRTNQLDDLQYKIYVKEMIGSLKKKIAKFAGLVDNPRYRFYSWHDLLQPISTAKRLALDDIFTDAKLPLDLVELKVSVKELVDIVGDAPHPKKQEDGKIMTIESLQEKITSLSLPAGPLDTANGILNAIRILNQKLRTENALE